MIMQTTKDETKTLDYPFVWSSWALDPWIKYLYP